MISHLERTVLPGNILDRLLEVERRLDDLVGFSVVPDGTPAGSALTVANHLAIGNFSPHHAPITLGGGSDPALALSGQQLTLADVLTPAEHTAIGDAAPHHAAVTLDANADTLLSLSTQQLGLDTQVANRVLAGPAAGVGAVPTFRALVAADLPAGGWGSGTAGRLTQWAVGGATVEDSTLVKSGAGVLTLTAAGAYQLDANASGGVLVRAAGTPLTAGQVAFASDGSTLTGDSGLFWDNINKKFGVGTTSATAQLQVHSGSASTITQILRGAASQTANLTEWQNSGGTILANIGATGELGVGMSSSTASAINAFKSDAGTANINAMGFTVRKSSGATSGNINGVSGNTQVIAGASAATAGIVSGLSTSVTLTGSGANAASASIVSGLRVGSPALTAPISITSSRLYGINILDQGNALLATSTGLRIEDQTGSTTNNYAIYTNAGLNRLGDQLSIVGSADRQQLVVTGHTTQAVATPIAQITRNDTAAGVSAMLGLTALGSGANGDGGSILMAGKSSAASRSMAALKWLYVNATDAAYTVDLLATVWDKAGEREILRGRSSGSAPMLSFYGGTPVVRGAALTAQLTTITHAAPGVPDYAIQDFLDVSGGAGWAFASQDEANTVLSVIANLQVRLGELEARLNAGTGVNLIA